MVGLLTKRHPVSEPCRHCGMWHSAESGIDEATARRFAMQAIERCRKLRALHGLPDEGAPPEHPTTTTTENH